MVDHNKHMVSKVSWATSCSDRRIAHALQNEISQWSKNKLASGLNAVLDEMCPPDQIWKIDKLELDLGIIDHNDMAGQLSSKFPKALTEQLKDLLFVNMRRSPKIEVSRVVESYLTTLEHFLVKGYMPWWYTVEQASLKDVVNKLLNDHRLALINKIRSLAKSPEIRKRLVLQLDDQALLSIVKGLEPYNYDKLISFKEHLCQLASANKWTRDATELSRESWLWLFNYLLTERKGLFDHTGFMGYLLTQLQNQFEILPKDLISGVRDYFGNQFFGQQLQSDLETLFSSFPEGKLWSPNTRHKRSPFKPKDWQQLSEAFDLSLSTKTSSTSEALELLRALAIHDGSHLKRWLLALKENQGKWQSFLEQLDHSTYITMLMALAPQQADMLVDSTSLMARVFKAQKLISNEHTLWEHGLGLALKHSDRTSLEAAVEYLINAVSDQHKLTLDQIMAGFQMSSFKDQPKSRRTLEVVKKLTSWTARKDQNFDSKAFANRVKALLKQLDDKQYRSDSAKNLYEQLNRWVMVYPVHVMAVFRDFFRSAELPVVLLQSLDESSVSHMIRQLGVGYHRLVMALEQHWQKLIEDRQMNHTYTDNGPLGHHALRLLFQQPNLSNKSFVQALIVELASVLTNKEVEHLRDSLEELLDSQLKKDEKFTAEEWKALDVQFSKRHDDDFLIKTHELIALPSSNQVSVGSFLLTHYDHQEFTKARRSESTDIKLILNYFIKEGVQFKKTLLSKSMPLLQKEIRALGIHSVENDLTDLYWTCVLSYKDHWGQYDAIQKSFDRAISFHYGKHTNLIRLELQDPTETQLDVDLLKSIVHEGITKAIPNVNYHNQKYSLSESINLLISSSPGSFVAVLADIKISDRRLSALAANLDFGDITWRLMSESKYRKGMAALRTLHFLIVQQANKGTSDKLISRIWRQLWQYLYAEIWNGRAYKTLVKTVVTEIQQTTGQGFTEIIGQIERIALPIDPILRDALVQINSHFDQLSAAEESNSTLDSLTKCDDHGLTETLVSDLFTYKGIPAWFNGTLPHALPELIPELLNRFPQTFQKQLKAHVQSGQDLDWLAKSINMEDLVKAITHANPNLQPNLDPIQKMHQVFKEVLVADFSTRLTRQTIVRKVLVAWCNENWTLVSSENIWNELIYEVCVKGGYDQDQFIAVIDQELERFPYGLQLAFRQCQKEENQLMGFREDQPDFSIQYHYETEKTNMTKNGIKIMNAGQVILNNYIQVLFERLQLLDGNQFKDKKAQQKAVLFLQYVITGMTKTEEFHLVLNKVLCGLPPATPIMNVLEIDEKERELIKSLIEAMITHWPDIGKTSIEGFRGNWLVRDGILTEEEDRWELLVDKRPYDLLLAKAPYGISIIKYPWMSKPIHVSWPY